MRVALTGASGYIGGRLAPRLIDAGCQLRCLVRSPQKLNERPWIHQPGVEILESDLANYEQLVQQLQGCDAAYYLVHSMLSAGAEYAERDRKLAETFSAACKAAGVGRIIYLGGLGDDSSKLSKHLQSRREIESALASGGVPVTVLRAAMIIGSGSASFEILRYLVERLPIMITPKWVKTKCQPIAVRNVVNYLLGVLAHPETSGQMYEIGGPEVLEYREIMQVMAQEAGLRRRIIIPVPVMTPRLSSYWIHLVTPLSARIARPLAEGLRNPVVVKDDRVRSILQQDLLTVRESIRLALTHISEQTVETHWSMAGPIPGDPDWAGGTLFCDRRRVLINATPRAVFSAVTKVGGGHGWYAADWLWRLRGALDRLVGGPGLRRGRRHPETLAYGEALDFWRVVAVESERRLALRAEMKTPGEAMLEFAIDPRDGMTELAMTAKFQPKGLLGLFYWYSVLPFHSIVFSGMLKGIKREAEGRPARASTVIRQA